MDERNPTQATEFLATLYPEIEGYIEVRIIGNGKRPRSRFRATTESFPWQDLSRANANGYNIYFGVGLRRRQAGSKEDVLSIPALWADLDGKEFADGKDEALQVLHQRLPPELQPSIVLDSGHGMHAYWLLREPYTLDGNGDQEQVEGIVRGLAEHLGGDRAVADVARLMRLPGFLNVKDPAEPVLCTILEMDPAQRFNLDDFHDYRLETLPVISTEPPEEPGAADWGRLIMTIEGIKEALSIAEIVSETFPLTGHGRYLRAKQHDSLVVDVQRQAWYWNSRGIHGDVLDWLGYQRLGEAWWNRGNGDFRDVLREAADRAGIVLRRWTSEESAKALQRRAAEDVLALAADYYGARLWETPAALEYARNRGWTDDTMRDAKLGYADGGLAAFLREQGADLALARRAGLLREDDRDFFRQRLVFPFLRSGRVLYMTGRALSPEAQPKYLHLPLAEGQARPLYGADALRGDGRIVLVEGPADVLTLQQWQTPAVALLGTSLSPEHVPHLQRHKTLFLALDNDDAGREGTQRLAEVLGPLVRCLSWPEGVHDANDYARQGGTAEDLRNLLDSAPTWLDLCIEDTAGQRGAERDEAIERLFRLLAILDPLPLARYKGKVTKALEEIGSRVFDQLLKAVQELDAPETVPPKVLEGQYTLIAPALDFLDGLAVVTIPLLAMAEGKATHVPHLITSDRQMLPADGQQLVHIGGQQVVLRDPPTALGTATRWGYAHVQEYLRGKSPDPIETYREAERLLDKYVDFREAGTSDVLALWIIGSYLYPLFEAYPYVALTGPKGSGKTKTLDVIARLAFNARVSSSMSPASLFRVVQATRGVLGIDEAERLSNPRDPVAADLRLLLNAGYKRGSPAIRCEGDDHRVVEFEVYGPKVIASIRGLEDVLESRCILIHMLRTTGPKGNLVVSEQGEDWARARHGLYCFALQHFASVRERYVAGAGASGLSNRQAELWRPLLAIAATLQELGAQGLLAMAQDYALQKAGQAEEASLDDQRTALLLALHKLSVLEGKDEVTPTGVRQAMAGFLDEPDDVTSQWVGYRLKEFGFQQHRTAGKRLYAVSGPTVQDVLARYGVGVD